MIALVFPFSSLRRSGGLFPFDGRLLGLVGRESSLMGVRRSEARGKTPHGRRVEFLATQGGGGGVPAFFFSLFFSFSFQDLFSLPPVGW